MRLHRCDTFFCRISCSRKPKSSRNFTNYIPELFANFSNYFFRPDTDINLATYYGTTALTYAIRCGNDEAVQLLLSRRDLDVNFQVLISMIFIFMTVLQWIHNIF